MPSLNRVELIGHVGADPELKYTPSNVPVCNFSMATSWKSGEKEYTEWHRIVVWDKLAEITSQRLKKGHLVMVEGRIQTRQYEKDGQKHYATDIVATKVLFLERSKEVSSGSADKSDRATSKPSKERNPDRGVAKPSSGSTGGNPEDDEVPF